jgi:hypothetical protein
MTTRSLPTPLGRSKRPRGRQRIRIWEFRRSMTWSNILLMAVSVSAVSISAVSIGFVGLWTAAVVVVSASSTNSNNNNPKQASSSTYVSSRALDDYGSLIQVSHAYEAAQRHGRLVVAAVIQQPGPTTSTSSSTPTNISPSEEDQNYTPSPPSFLVVVSIGTTPIVQPIQLPLQQQHQQGQQMGPLSSSSSSSSLIAICCTGVRGDARWLTTEIQQYLSSMWERYDTNGVEWGTPGVAYAISRLMCRFVGHDENDEWQSAIGGPAPIRQRGGGRDDDVNRGNIWSRPFGVRTMILSTGLDSQQPQPPQQQLQQPAMLLVDPSGRILTPGATNSIGTVCVAAIGKESERIERRLIELFHQNRSNNNQSNPNYRSGMMSSTELSSSWEDRPPTLEECKKALIDIIMDEIVLDGAASSGNGGGFFSNPFGGKKNQKKYTTLDGNLVVETFSSDKGVLDYQRIPYTSWLDH